MSHPRGRAEVVFGDVEVDLAVKVSPSQVQCTLVFEDNEVVLTFGRNGMVSGIKVPGLSGWEARDLITEG